MNHTPTIVCLCGPTRYREAYRRANARYTLRGYIVLSCGVFKGDPEWGEPSKVALDELHLRKIDLASEICLIGGRELAGESTRREIAYAEGRGLPIVTWEGLE